MEDDKSNIFATELWQKKEKVDIAQLCRACANPSDSLIAIFESEGIENDLSTKINKHLPIQVLKEDSLPTKLCYPCTSTLVSWHDMLVTCIEADKKLRSLVSSVGDPIPAASDDDDGCADDSFMDFMDDNNDDDSNDEEKDFTPDNKFVPEALASTSKSLATKQNDNSGIMSFDVIQDEIGPDTDPITSSKLFESDPVATTSSASDNLTAPTGEPDDERKGHSVREDIIDNLSENENVSVESNIQISIKNSRKKRRNKKAAKMKSNKRVKGNVTEIVPLKYGKAEIKTKIRSHVGDSDGINHINLNRDVINDISLKEGDDDVAESFECAMCGAKYSRKSILIRHIRRHSGANKSICHICGKVLSSPSSLKYHIDEHHGHKKARSHVCHICGRSFTCKPFLVNHFRSHTGERPFVCEVCGKAYAHAATLHCHRKIHEDYFPFSCDICNKKFRSKYHLKNHNYTHTKEKNFQCETCLKWFSRIEDRNRHKQIHNEVFLYKCDICMLPFKVKRYLQWHIRKKHKTVEETIDPQFSEVLTSDFNMAQL